MRQPNSGSTLPRTFHSWAVTDQTLAGNTVYSRSNIACQGARFGNAIVAATPRGALPRTGGGCDPCILAYCDADDLITLRISNNNANPTVPLAVPVIIDILVFPLTP